MNKIVEVQGLELYCNTFQGSDKLMSVDSAVGSKIWGGALLQANEKVNLLAPLDVTLSLSVCGMYFPYLKLLKFHHPDYY